VTPLLTVECVGKSFGERRVLSSAFIARGARRVANSAGSEWHREVDAPQNRRRPHRAGHGSIHFDGRAHLAARLREMAADGLFYLPDHDLLSTAFTVRQQARDDPPASSVAGISRRRWSEWELSHIDKRPQQLSGGERRRAELAAVFVRKPRCLLADEPYRGVAPKDAEDLTAAFCPWRGWSRDRCHGPRGADALGAADHVTWCTSGATYELGPGRPSRRRNAQHFGATTRGRGSSQSTAIGFEKSNPGSNFPINEKA
jgi:hypothetical protein